MIYGKLTQKDVDKWCSSHYCNEHNCEYMRDYCHIRKYVIDECNKCIDDDCKRCFITKMEQIEKYT